MTSIVVSEVTSNKPQKQGSPGGFVREIVQVPSGKGLAQVLDANCLYFPEGNQEATNLPASGVRLLVEQLMTVNGLSRVAGYFFSRVTTALAGLAISFFLIRTVAQTDYNKYASIQASLSFFAPIVFLWIQNSALRFGGEKREWDLVILAYAVLTVAVYIPLQFFSLNSLNLGLNLTSLGALAGAFLGLTPVLGNILRSQDKEGAYNVTDGLASLSKILCIGVLLVTTLLTVRNTLLVVIVISLAQACLLWRIGRLKLGGAMADVRIICTTISLHSRELFLYAVPLAIAGFISSVTQYFDRVFISRSIFAPHIGEYFFTASLGATTVATLLTPINMAIYPKCIRMYREGKPVNTMITLGILVCLGVFAVVSAIFACFGEDVVRILSSGKFVFRIGWLELFALSQVLAMINNLLQIPLHLAKRDSLDSIDGHPLRLCVFFSFPVHFTETGHYRRNSDRNNHRRLTDYRNIDRTEDHVRKKWRVFRCSTV